MGNISKKGMSILLAFVMIFSMMTGLGTVSFAAPDPDLVLSLKQTVDVVNPLTGTDFTYTIKYSTGGSYGGNTNVTGLKIVETLHEDLEVVSYDVTSNIKNVEHVGNKVTFNFNDGTEIGSTGVLKLVVRFKAGTTLGGTIDNISQAVMSVGDNAVTAKAPPVTANVNNTTVIPVSKTYTPSKPGLDYSVFYKIVVNGEQNNGGRIVENAEVVDTLPVDAVYVSSTPEGTYDTTTRKLTWSNQTIGIEAVKEYIVEVKYPSEDGNGDTLNQVGDSITNTVNVTGNHYKITDTVTGSATSTHSLFGYTTGSLAVDKQNRYGVDQNFDNYSPGQTALFRIYGVRNAANFPLKKLELEDVLPVDPDDSSKRVLELKNIWVGNINYDIPVSVYYKTEGEEYKLYKKLTDLVDNEDNRMLDFQTTTPDEGTVTLSDIMSIKLVFGDDANPVPVGFVNPGILVKAKVITDREDSTVDYTNTAKLSGTYDERDDQGTVTEKTVDALPDSASFKVTGATPYYDLSYTTSRLGYDDRTDIDYTLQLTNYNLAKGDILNPVLAVEFDNRYFEGMQFDPTAQGAVSFFAHADNFEGQGNANYNAGRSVTQLSPVTVGNKIYYRFQVNGLFKPNDYVRIRFTNSVIDNSTPTGYYPSKAYVVVPSEVTSYDKTNETVTNEAAVAELFETGNNTLLSIERSIFNKYHGTVKGLKSVKGELDAAFTSDLNEGGKTVPGGYVEYELKISNATGGNGPVSNLVMIDKLPAVGDKMITSSQPRGSEWTPYLIGKAEKVGSNITSGSEGTLEIYYSTEANPNKSILDSPATIAPNGDWTLTPPENITDVTHIMFRLNGTVLNTGDYVTVKYKMVAPVGAPTNKKAYNSFAYGATYPDSNPAWSPFLPSEPAKVFHVIEQTNDEFGIGNRVFLDKNNDGIDNDDEGVNNVRVVLYKDNAGTFTRLRHTYTNNNQENKKGYYLFPKTLPQGKYEILFLVPKSEGYKVAKKNKGTDETVDSDVALITDLTGYDFEAGFDETAYDVYSYKAANGHSLDLISGQPSNEYLDKVSLGLYKDVEITGYVYNDLSHDSRKHPSEPYIDGTDLAAHDLVGMTLTLTGTAQDGSPLSMDLPIDANGKFTTTVPPGDYQLRLKLPQDTEYVFSTLIPYGAGPNAFNSDGYATFKNQSTTLSALSGDKITKYAAIHKARMVGSVWFDGDRDGRNAPNSTCDGYLGGFKVDLYKDGNNTVYKTTTSDNSGNYSINNLDSGTYKIVVTPSDDASNGPVKFLETIKATPGNGNTYDPRNSYVESKAIDGIVVAKGQNKGGLGAGYYKNITVGGFIFNDKNHDGFQSNGEGTKFKNSSGTDLDKITLTITGGDLSSPTTVDATWDDNSKRYVYSKLLPPSKTPYVIAFDNPNPNSLTVTGVSPASTINGPNTKNVFSLDANNNNKIKFTYDTPVSTKNGTTVHINAGLHKSLIKVKLFEDKNNNGTIDNGDVFIGDDVSTTKDVVILLYKKVGGNIVGTPIEVDPTELTSVLSNLDPDSYELQVKIKKTLQFVKGTGNDGVLDTSDPEYDIYKYDIPITKGTKVNKTLGFYKAATISTKVFEDSNFNGERDNLEEFGNNVKRIEVYQGNTKVKDFTYDNNDKDFKVSGLAPGTYTVKYILKDKFAVTKYVANHDENADDFNDIDSTSATPERTVTLVSGEVNNKVDLGVYQMPVVKGTVISERGTPNGTNTNGTEDILYNGKITIKVYDNLDAFVKDVEVTVTDGEYQFELAPGRYRFEYLLPNGYVRSPINAGNGNDINQTTGKTDWIMLNSGAEKEVNYAFYRGAKISGKVFDDLNDDDSKDPNEPYTESTVELLDSNGDVVATVQTTNNGEYIFDNVPPGTYSIRVTKTGYGTKTKTPITVGASSVTTIADIGLVKPVNIVVTEFLDKNKDGINNPLTALSEIKLQLWKKNSSGTFVKEGSEITPDALGKHTFENLAPGTYKLQAVIPATIKYLKLTQKDAGTDDLIDSDINPADKFSDEIVITSGLDDVNVGVGAYKVLNISGNVKAFITDLPIRGAVLELLDKDGNPVLINNVPVTFTTDATGNYNFDGLDPAKYQIRVTAKYIDENGAEKSYPEIIKPVAGQEGGDLVIPFVCAKYQITFDANPELIVGNGAAESLLTFTIRKEDGTAIGAPIPITFDVKTGADGTPLDVSLQGTFKESNGDPHVITLNTSPEGVADTPYTAADLSGYLKPMAVRVTAKASIDGHQLTDSIVVVFEPVSISGTVRGEGDKVFGNAKISITKRFQNGALAPNDDRLLEKDGYKLYNDGNDLVFEYSGRTDLDGNYHIFVPYGDEKYDLKVLIPAHSNSTGRPIEFNQQTDVGTSNQQDALHEKADITIVGTLSVDKPDGKNEIPQFAANEGSLSVEYEQNGTATLEYSVQDGVLQHTNSAVQLKQNESYTRKVYYQFPGTNEKIIVAQKTYNTIKNGDLIVDEILIDPRGYITDSVTGRPVADAEVKLYYKNGNQVPLPPNNLGLSNNANPQFSNEDGEYAWMVFPNSEYYIIAKKPGYHTYDSRVSGGMIQVEGVDATKHPQSGGHIKVEDSIVYWDFKMTPLAPPDDTEEKPTTGTYEQEISAKENTVFAGEVIETTVDYTNITDRTLAIGHVKVRIPDGLEVIPRDDLVVNGRYVYYRFKYLKPGEVRKVNINFSTAKVKKSKVFEFRSVLVNSLYQDITGFSHAMVKVYYIESEELFPSYIYGRPDGGFHPDDDITRAEVAAILVRNTVGKTPGEGKTFKDVEANDWFYDEVMMAVKYGYFNGYPDGTFKPDEMITRGELARALVNFFGINSREESGFIERFKDINDSYFKRDIEIVARNKMVNGYKDKTYRPNNDVNRSEAVKMFNRLLFRFPTPDVERSFNDITKNFWAFGHIESSFRGFKLIKRDGKTIVRPREKTNIYYKK